MTDLESKASAPMGGECTVVMDQDAMASAVRRLAQEIIQDNQDIPSMALLGILKRGRPLAYRLKALIEEMTGVTPDVGDLATTLYRDDLRAGMGKPKISGGQTHFDFDVDGRTIVLVDDVVMSGRTIRAALDEIIDYGRPKRVQLACLIDRGHRELPIQPDFLGWAIETAPEDHVAVRFKEADGEDVVLLERGIVSTDKGGQ